MTTPAQAAAAPLTALLADPSVCPQFKRAVASSPAMDRAEAAIAMNARTQTADLLVGTLIRLTAEQQHVDPAFREGLRDSPALRRAEHDIATRYARKVRQDRWHHVKLGAETILGDLKDGRGWSLERALAAPLRSDARLQAKLALRWRNRFGTFAIPPTKRTTSAHAAWERLGEVG